MFKSPEEFDEMLELLEAWTDDPPNIKGVFVRLKDKLLAMKDVSLSFMSRPGVSYSLRANISYTGRENRNLFALVDIVDDQAEERWLSVCFYSDLITDPGDEGNLVPGGILGEDGYCFDLFECDWELISYIEQRVDEAFANA
ncbi:MAG: hypothetical protein JRJ15_13715 [Deltaproteobacteria bacterium]|nr:hypothetical protein [Deltaproteobacteria bacterium]